MATASLRWSYDVPIPDDFSDDDVATLEAKCENHWRINATREGYELPEPLDLVVSQVRLANGRHCYSPPHIYHRMFVVTGNVRRAKAHR